MSGGSWGYMARGIRAGKVPDPGDMDLMAERLGELGAAHAQRDLSRLAGRLREALSVVEAVRASVEAHAPLVDAVDAVERHDSGDLGPMEVAQVLHAYEALPGGACLDAHGIG